MHISDFAIFANNVQLVTLAQGSAVRLEISLYKELRSTVAHFHVYILLKFPNEITNGMKEQHTSLCMI